MEHVWTLLIAAATSLAATPLARWVAHRAGALDHPVHRKGLVQRIVPRLGGLGIAAGYWVGIGAYLAWHGSAVFEPHTASVSAILVGGGAVLLLGVFDDFRGLRARTKFFVQFLVAAMVLNVAPDLLLERVALPGVMDLPLGWLAMPLTILWVVGVTNAFNLIDGLDGLAAGVGMIACLCLALVAAEFQQPAWQVMTLAMGGACLGFLRYNFRSATIFLGDSGSLLLGFTIATLALAVDDARPAGGSLLIPAVIMGFPILDTLLVMARRAAVGKSMFHGDQRHIHHQLLARGFSRTASVVALYVLTLVFGFVGVVWAMDIRSLSWGGAAVLLGILLIGGKVLRYDQLVSPKRIGQLRHERWRYKKLHRTAGRAVDALRRTEDVQSVLNVLNGVMSDYELFRIELSVRRGSDPAAPPEPLACLLPGGELPQGRHHHEEYQLLEGFVHARVTVLNDHLTPKLVLERNIQLNHVLDVMAQRLEKITR